MGSSLWFTTKIRYAFAQSSNVVYEAGLNIAKSIQFRKSNILFVMLLTLLERKILRASLVRFCSWKIVYDLF